MTPVQQMIEAAEAVCRRWDSRDWKDAPTADYIAALRIAAQALRATLPGLRDAGEPVAYRVDWRPECGIGMPRFFGADDRERMDNFVRYAQFPPVVTPLYAAPPSPAPQPAQDGGEVAARPAGNPAPGSTEEYEDWAADGSPMPAEPVAALRRIERLTMSQFVTRYDMAEECVNIARAALSAQQQTAEGRGERVSCRRGVSACAKG